MIRMQIYLTKKEKMALASIATIHGISQSDLIRQAIDHLIFRPANINKQAILDEIAGIWVDRDDFPDIRELRRVPGLKY
jgi:hypothetical protein